MSSAVLEDPAYTVLLDERRLVGQMPETTMVGVGSLQHGALMDVDIVAVID